MTKRLVVLLGMLAVMLAAAVPAFAQQQGSVTATGVLVGPVENDDPDPTPEYRLTDETTGTTYVGVSGFVDLAPFAGQRVIIAGAPIGGADWAPPALNVTHIEPAEGPGDGGTVTATFELAVECQPPEGATFYGMVGQQPAELSDPDGDGAYTGSLTLPEDFYAPGPFPIPVWITTGTSQIPNQQTIEDFGEVVLEDGDHFSASTSFCDGGSPGDGGGGGGGARVLPATGGALPIAGLLGALLVGGGLLVRRIAR